MSIYENYTTTSKYYDNSRIPIGSEILTGCLTQSSVSLSEMVVLDAGCGTGSYSKALRNHVGKIVAIDLNRGMIGVARKKLNGGGEKKAVDFHMASIENLPFQNAVFDGIMINQVLHHLKDNPSKDYPAYHRIFMEFSRVLKPGGILVINTCSQHQLKYGYWYYCLIEEALKKLRSRFIPLEDLTGVVGDCGFEEQGKFVPVDATVQGEAYFDLHGPSKEKWRGGDSIWALVDPNQLGKVLFKMRELERGGEIDSFLADHDARRDDYGQITFLSFLRK